MSIQIPKDYSEKADIIKDLKIMAESIQNEFDFDRATINALIAENQSYKNQIPKGTASGESITIDDSSDLPINNAKIRGKIEQETSTTGKNKFNLGEDSYQRSGIDVTIEKNRITLNGTTNSSNNLFISGKFFASYLYLGKFKAGTYRFSKFITSGKYEINREIGTGLFGCYIRKKDKTHLCDLGNDASDGSGATITLTEDTDLYFHIWMNAGAVFTNYVLEWQLEEGDSTTDLEEFIPNMPSIECPSPIQSVSGENKFIFNNKNWLQTGDIPSGNGITVTKINETTYKLNGTCTTAGRLLATKTFDIDNDSKYVLSCKLISGTATGRLYSYIYDGHGSWDRITDSCLVNSSISSDSMYAKIKSTKGQFGMYINTDVVCDNAILSFQFEKGDTATDHIEHQSQSYSISLGEYEIFEDGYLNIEYEDKAGYKTITKASVVNSYGKIILDGTTNTINYKHTSITTETNAFFQLKLPAKKKTATIDEKCNYLKVVRGSAGNAIKENCLWREDNSEYVYLSIPFLTLAEANAWLQELNTAGTPLEIVYPLETPTETEITDSTLLAQLEALINAETYKNVTHINTTAEGLKPEVKLVYKKDLETMFNNLNTAIVALGGV